MRDEAFTARLLWLGQLFLAVCLLTLSEQQSLGLRGTFTMAFQPALNSAQDLFRQLLPSSASRSSEERPEGQPAEGTGGAGGDAERLRELQAELIRNQEENERLKALLKVEGVNDQGAIQGIRAQVVRACVSNQQPLLWIDRGLNDGIQTHAGVLYQGAVLGRVVSASATHAGVRLLTHPRLQVAVRIQGSREEGFLEGGLEHEGEWFCQLTLFKRDPQAKPGDQVVTSGLDGSFPAGCWVGTVVRVVPAGRFQWSLWVRPSAPLEGVEAVKVIVKPEVR